MVDVTAAMVKELREATGAAFNDCRTALQETGGDIAKATDYLRKKGIATAAKKAGRAANEGIVQSYAHHTGRMAVIVEVNCETDFVARNEHFKEFAKQLALHVANAAPKYLKREDIPQDVVERERSVQIAKTMNEGKPENIAAKIVDGRLGKWYEEIVLMEQPWFFDDNKKVSEILTTLVAETKENVVIRRFARFEIGESAGEQTAE